MGAAEASTEGAAEAGKCHGRYMGAIEGLAPGCLGQCQSKGICGALSHAISAYGSQKNKRAEWKPQAKVRASDLPSLSLRSPHKRRSPLQPLPVMQLGSEFVSAHHEACAVQATELMVRVHEHHNRTIGWGF